MKIIKEGKVPYTVEWFNMQCDLCETVFECTEFECTWTDASGNHMLVKCPVCGQRCEFDSDE